MILERLEVGPLAVNCYIIGSKEGGEAAVIDPGGNPDDIMSVLETYGLSKNLRYILATHGHFDHIGAAQRLKELTSAHFLIHRGDLELLDSLDEQASYFGCQAVDRPSVDMFVEDGDEIVIGDIILQVAHTPGHSRGGVCYITEGKAFVGDTLFAGSVGRTDFPGCSFEELVASIQKKLMCLEDAVEVYPGHGPPTTIGEERRSNPFLASLRF